MTDEIVVRNQGFIAPVANVETALQTYQAMKDFVEGVLRETVDFGAAFPGSKKPTLLKPGSEKLLRFFGLSTRIETLEKVEDWMGKDHGGEPLFFYRYKSIAMRGDQVIAEAIGSCSSWEKKYRYRKAERICPNCGQHTIKKSKFPPKNDLNGEPGWYCYSKMGGCGAEFDVSDTNITEQEVGQILNPNPADQANTIDKMAQKRANVAVTLLACNASEYFTQDIEDYTEGTFTVKEPAKKSPQDTKGLTTPPNAKMSIEMAMATVGGDDKKYSECTDKELSGKIIGCNTALKTEKDAKKRERYEMKRDAAQTILDARSA